MNKFIDKGNMIVIVLTIALFFLALFAKGLTKDLLLEVGVLLVSVKLIMFNYKQSVFNKDVIDRLDEIKKDLASLKK